MTVASLWSVLDEAGCGKAVGPEDMVDRNKTLQRINPWNYNEMNAAVGNAENRTSLAVDLSIWICEALTSTAMSTNHAEPVLHLVYTRTTRLLSMGIKLVAVIEGKRRIRRSAGEEDSFRKRRSGTAFWKACRGCEDMLKTLGVPVVRAKAEGEALCALLNQRDIVDGVISNDGDCFLFGAKVVYTRFSIDNLDKKQVIRYDASELRGRVSDTEDDADNNTAAAYECATSREKSSCVTLSRDDLVSFALLTGSDLAGNGLPKVGHKKAIRFIKQCQLDYPLSPITAAIDELKSWARSASVLDVRDANANKGQERCCSLCCHPGDKRSHEKDGCETCGTKPGEPCFAASAGDKFRKALRAKALAMIPKFDPSFVMAAYMKPNDNQVPLTLAGETARSLRMNAPRLGDMMNFPHIIKGQSLAASRDYVKQSMARLLARTQLFNDSQPHFNKGGQKRRLSREQPIPIEITRKLVHNKVSCYDISWSVSATVTDSEGNGIDGYEFSTIEAQTLVEKRHPDLVRAFLEREKEEAKQGDAEANRRRRFLMELLDNNDNDELKEAGDDAAKPIKKGRHNIHKRAGFFERKRANGFDAVPRHAKENKATGGDDVQKLMAIADLHLKAKAEEFDYSPIEEDIAKSDLDETKKAMLTQHSTTVPMEICFVRHQEGISIGRPSEMGEGQAPTQGKTLQLQQELRRPMKTSHDHESLRKNAYANHNIDVLLRFDKNTLKDQGPDYQPRRKRECEAKTLVNSDANNHAQKKRCRQCIDFQPIRGTETVTAAGQKDRTTATPILQFRFSPCKGNNHVRNERDRKAIHFQAINRTDTVPAAGRKEHILTTPIPKVSLTCLQEMMPVLTPGRVVCDMGIGIDITPLVSSKQLWV